MPPTGPRPKPGRRCSRPRTSSRFVEDYSAQPRADPAAEGGRVRRFAEAPAELGRGRCRGRRAPRSRCPTRPSTRPGTSRPTEATRSSRPSTPWPGCSSATCSASLAGALEAARTAARRRAPLSGTIWPIEFGFWNGLTLAAKYAEAPEEAAGVLAGARWTRRGERSPTLAEHCRENFLCQSLLLSAEIERIGRARSRGRRSCYEQAIGYAERHGHAPAAGPGQRALRPVLAGSGTAPGRRGVPGRGPAGVRPVGGGGEGHGPRAQRGIGGTGSGSGESLHARAPPSPPPSRKAAASTSSRS